MVSRPQGSLRGPSPLKAGSTATWRCWMNSHSNTWRRTAARSRTSCSGSKRYYRYYMQKDVNEHERVCSHVPKLAHTYTYALCTVQWQKTLYYMFVIVLMLRLPLNMPHSNNMQIISPLPAFYFGLIMRPRTVNCQDFGLDFSCCFAY